VPEKGHSLCEIGTQGPGKRFAQVLYVRYGLFPKPFLMAGKLHGEQAYVVRKQRLPREEGRSPSSRVREAEQTRLFVRRDTFKANPVCPLPYGIRHSFSSGPLISTI
jgi:hypothetical protein